MAVWLLSTVAGAVIGALPEEVTRAQSVDLEVVRGRIFRPVVEEAHRAAAPVLGPLDSAAAAGHTLQRHKRMLGRGQGTGT